MRQLTEERDGIDAKGAGCMNVHTLGIDLGLSSATPDSMPFDARGA